MASMIHIDWAFIIFTILVAGFAGGALLCFRHMMHEGKEAHRKEAKSNLGSGDEEWT